MPAESAAERFGRGIEVVSACVDVGTLNRLDNMPKEYVTKIDGAFRVTGTGVRPRTETEKSGTVLH